MQRALRLMEAAAEHPHGTTAKQLARRAELPLSTTYHLLRTLVHEGYLQRDRGRYSPGEATLGLTPAAPRHANTAGWLTTLSRDLDAAVYYALYVDGEVRLTHAVDGPSHAGIQEWAPFSESAHSHAVGLCLLAQLDEASRRDHLDRYPPVPLTRNTLTEPETVLSRLARIRRGEPVLENGEYERDTVCAAVPVTIGAVPSAIAISLPRSESHRLHSTAQELKARMERTLTSFAFTVTE
ncbi:helix-turn-helix domain-containing protein [Streptomyces sp. NBC_00876]|uniref:IclR family transcriptional regulator n=1 Tax=Streptomyces sp. NBC_00876 TaxID=2975853 RepID=UPI003868585B|nr:helix-turn-helix domain-containing protein [Streptomyces sp. NBC_00876]